MPVNTSKDVRTNGHKSTTGGGKWEKYSARPQQASVCWGDVHASAIGECVHAVTACGDALLFGNTRDGGALVLTICSGDKRYRLYAATASEMEQHLADVENQAKDNS